MRPVFLPAPVTRKEIEFIRSLAADIGTWKETALRAAEIKELADVLLRRTLRTHKSVVESWVCRTCIGRGHLVVGIVRNIYRSDAGKCGCWCGCHKPVTDAARFRGSI